MKTSNKDKEISGANVKRGITVGYNTIIIDGSEYKIEYVYNTNRVINKSICIGIQLLIFKDGLQLENHERDEYADKIMKYFEELLKELDR